MSHSVVAKRILSTAEEEDVPRLSKFTSALVMDQVQARAQVQVDYKEQAVEDQQEVVVEDVAEDPKAHDGFSILIESEQPKCPPIYPLQQKSDGPPSHQFVPVPSSTCSVSFDAALQGNLPGNVGELAKDQQCTTMAQEAFSQHLPGAQGIKGPLVYVINMSESANANDTVATPQNFFEKMTVFFSFQKIRVAVI